MKMQRFSKLILSCALGAGIMLISASEASTQSRDRSAHSGQHRGGGGSKWDNRGNRLPPMRRYHRGYYGDGGGFLGGVLGGILGTTIFAPEPEVVIVQPPQRGVEWCLQRYKSYDVYTRTYLGFDGLRHGCP